MVAPGALVLLLKYAGAGAGASSGPRTGVLLDIPVQFCSQPCGILDGKQEEFLQVSLRMN